VQKQKNIHAKTKESINITKFKNNKNHIIRLKNYSKQKYLKQHSSFRLAKNKCTKKFKNSK